MLLYGETGAKTESDVPRITHHFNIRDLPGDPACKTVLLITPLILGKMVEQGLIRKVGTKRWTRYVL